MKDSRKDKNLILYCILGALEVSVPPSTSVLPTNLHRKLCTFELNFVTSKLPDFLTGDLVAGRALTGVQNSIAHLSSHECVILKNGESVLHSKCMY